MTYFEKFKEKWPSKEKFYNLLTGNTVSDKEYDHVINVGINLKWKQWRIITTCT